MFRTGLLGGAAIGVLAATAVMAPAQAQDVPQAGDADADIITVTGYRASLRRSIENKRTADDIRDVISASEIGAMPDQNIAEALQRVPGVSITRDQGEGRFVTIRGLPPELSRVTINGMTAMSTSDSRAVPLDLFASELFGRLEVIKSPSAEDSEGGLAGQINLITPDPMDLEGPQLSVDVAAFQNDLAGEWDPRATVMAGNTFANGDLAVLGGISYSDRAVRQDAVFSGGWNPVGDFFGNAPAGTEDLDVWENGQLRLFDENRERLGLFGAVRHAPGSNLEYGFSALFSRYDLEQTKYQFLHRFKKGSEIFDIEAQDDAVVSAMIRDVAIGSNNQRRNEESDALVLTADAEWQAGAWSFTGELGYSAADVSVPSDLKYVWDGTGNVGYDLTDPYRPVFTFFGPSQETAYSDASLYTQLRQVVVEERDVEDAETRAAFDAEREIGRGFLDTLQFGLAVRDRGREQSATQFKYRDSSITDDGAAPLDQYNGNYAVSDYLGGAYPFWSTVVVDFDRARDGLVPAEGFDYPADLLNSYDVNERSLAAYGQMNFLSGPVSGNAGVRVVRTELDADGYGILNGGAPEAVSFSDEGTEVLPSANVRIELTDNLVLRGAAARVMARPAFDDVAPRQSVNEVALSVSQGNPDLDPYLANQFDASLEYYTGNDGIIAVSVFYKDVESFIFDQTRTLTIDNPADYGIDPSLAGESFNVTRPENGAGAELLGAEIAVQYTFDDLLPAPLAGFGINANLTYVDSDAEFMANEAGQDIEDEGGVGSQEFPLPGLSEWTANLQLFYERDRLNARIAYNWRDEFLLTPAGQEADPEFAASYEQIDAIIGYDVTDMISVYAEALNLTDEGYRAYTIAEPRLLEYSETGRRFFVGVRMRR